MAVIYGLVPGLAWTVIALLVLLGFPMLYIVLTALSEVWAMVIRDVMRRMRGDESSRDL